MSLYNMLHGVSPLAPLLLGSLGIDFHTVDRIRDVYLKKYRDEVVIEVFARTGGGNREHYPNAILTSHPNYIADEDDGFDNTYAHYYFRVPDELKKEAEAQGIKLEDHVETATLEDKTNAAVEAIKASAPPKGET